MKKLTIVVIVAIVLLTSCGTAVTGIYPYPVLNIETESITIPPQIVDGETHALNLQWSGGADTFTVTWIFDGGTLQTALETSGTELESTANITFNLDGTDPGTFSGMVQVIDERGNSLDQAFTYTVQAQS